MQPKIYRAMQRAQGKMLREYFSGVPVENLSKRYGYGIPKIKQLASDYKQGKIDIFDDVNKRKIAMSMMSHQEEVQMLQDKIRALENCGKGWRGAVFKAAGEMWKVRWRAVGNALPLLT